MWNIAIIILKKQEQMETEKTIMLCMVVFYLFAEFYRRYSRSNRYSSKMAATVARSSGVREQK